MLPGCCKNGLIISKTPLIQEGLKGAITGNFPDYKLAYCRTIEELTLLQLRRSNLVIADLQLTMPLPVLSANIFIAYSRNIATYIGYFWFLNPAIHMRLIS